MVTPQTRHWRDTGLRPALVWQWQAPLLAICSGPLGGGIGLRQWVVNAQVASDYSRRDPDQHLADIARSLDLRGAGAGMLTAADVTAARAADDDGISVLATVGLGYPVLAAAPGEQPAAPGEVRAAQAPGTINIVAVMPARLADAALVNAVITVTEAKTQALFEVGFAATGTASDAVCIVCPPGGPAEPFCGPRSPLGAPLARSVHAAVLAGAAR
jgi:adenosylcobinamide amidohydrolase